MGTTGQQARGQQLAEFVERGRYSDVEIVALVRQARSSRLAHEPLGARPSLAISMSGRSIVAAGQDVVFGVPGAAMDDPAIRKVAAACPEMWLDGRWFPADIGGIHMVLASSLTVVGHDGIAPQTAAMLDVDADSVRFMYDRDHIALRFAKLTWRVPRTSG